MLFTIKQVLWAVLTVLYILDLPLSWNGTKHLSDTLFSRATKVTNEHLKRHKPIRRCVQELIRVVWKWKHNTLPSKWRNVVCLHVRGVMKPNLSIPKQSLSNAMKLRNQALFQTNEIVVFMTAEYFKTWKHKTTLGPTTRFLMWDQMPLDNLITLLIFYYYYWSILLWIQSLHFV